MHKTQTARSKGVYPKHQRMGGVGLIEVLVTLIILSTALLTLTALQTRSLQFNHSAYLRSQANLFAYDILDRARINRGDVGSYNLAIDADTPESSTTSLVQRDLAEWRTLIATTLPGGTSGISCVSSTSMCTVTIQWEEQNTSGDTSEDSTTFTYTTLL